MFHIFLYCFPCNKRVGALCNNVFFNIWYWHKPIWSIQDKFLPIFVHYQLINYHIHLSDILNIELFWHHKNSTMFLCCSIMHHIRINLIHIITNTNLDRNKNIKNFSIHNWKINRILAWRGNFCFIFAKFISLNIVLWSLKNILSFIGGFNTDWWFSKLDLLFLPLNLEHSSHITSLNSVFHTIYPSNISL